MIQRVAIVALILHIAGRSDAFVRPTITRRPKIFSLSLNERNDRLEEGDAVLLIGPGFLQLNIAKAAKRVGLNPVIVAPQEKINSFVQYINDKDLINDAIIGIPDPGEAYHGDIAGVVYCAEDAILPDSIITTVLDWKDRCVFSPKGLKRAIACAPISGKINKEKSMGWVPVFNNDRKDKDVWTNFAKAFKSHPVMKEDGGGTLIRHGSLLGGSTDGANELLEVGLDECIYKMSLENYRDLKERSFDRYRLGAQILSGDSINIKPPNQEKMEKEAIKKGEYLEAFRAARGYPEVDRTNRHVAAQAVVQSLLRSSRSIPKEFSVISKCETNIPTTEEWDVMFEKPMPAQWPDPFLFDPKNYGFEAGGAANV